MACAFVVPYEGIRIGLAFGFLSSFIENTHAYEAIFSRNARFSWRNL